MVMSVFMVILLGESMDVSSSSIREAAGSSPSGRHLAYLRGSTRSGRPTRTHEAGLVGEHHELRPVTGVQLGHRPADVGLGRGGAHHESLRDLVVAQTLADERHDLA